MADSTKLIVAAMLACVTCCAAACGGGEQPTGASAESLAGAQNAGAPTAQDLQEYLFAEFDRLGIDPERVPAAAPAGSENAAFDLVATVIDPDGTGPAPPTGVGLKWTERAVGDYDQNGEVGITDLTPLGQFFGDTIAYDSASQHNGITWWPTGDPDGAGADNWRKARIDGDSNGELNISDITPIAVHWAERLDGYRVYRKGPGDAAFNLLSGPLTVGRGAVTAGEPVRYTFTDSGLGLGSYQYYVAPYDQANDDQGEASGSVVANLEGVQNEAPTADIQADPTTGGVPLTVDFDASGSSDPDGTIVKFEWDFDGDSVYDLDSGTVTSAQHIYDEMGSFRVYLRVTDSDTAIDLDSVMITVTEHNDPPVAALDADPLTGEVPLTVSFDASASDDPDGQITNFLWDWDGDGDYDDNSGWDPIVDHEYLTPGDYNATVRVLDNLGGSDTASVSLSFTGNYPPEADLTASPTEGDAPLDVSFNASGSIDPDGTIATYEWDWEGDGEYDLTGTSTEAHTYDDAGLFTATVRVTDDDGATDTASVEITVNGWRIVTVDTLGNSGQYASLEIVNGNPAIAYYRFTHGLCYARALDATGTNWGEPVRVFPDSDWGRSGQWNTLVIADGNPAVGFNEDLVGERLMFVRADDTNGESWPDTPVTVDETGDVGEYASTAIVEGLPAISYYDETNTHLLYIRATNAQGSAWGTRVVVDNTADAGWFNCLTVVNGNPAISYRWADMVGENPVGELRYVRANDAQGSTWGTKHTLDDEVRSGFHNKMAIVNGRPAIVYQWSSPDTENPDTDFRYIRAANDNGDTWGSFVTLSFELHVGRWASLGIFEGNPAASCYDKANESVLLYRATDADGSSWQGGDPPVAEVIDDFIGNEEAGHTSLLEVNGHPAMAFYDEDNDEDSENSKDLKYAVYI